jgi:hypothetical protein
MKRTTMPGWRDSVIQCDQTDVNRKEKVVPIPCHMGKALASGDNTQLNTLVGLRTDEVKWRHRDDLHAAGASFFLISRSIPQA